MKEGAQNEILTQGTQTMGDVRRKTCGWDVTGGKLHWSNIPKTYESHYSNKNV